MRKTSLALALVACLIAGCSPSRTSSGAATSFDLVVVQQEFGVYSIDGTRLDFPGVIAAIENSRAKAIAIRGARSLADVLCTSAIRMKTGKRVFLIPEGSDRPAPLRIDLTAQEVDSLMSDCSKSDGA
jgi:hypothetical protein